MTEIASAMGGSMQGKVEICGVNTSKLKTLKQEEMTQLLMKAREGDTEARDRLVE